MGKGVIWICKKCEGEGKERRKSGKGEKRKESERNKKMEERIIKLENEKKNELEKILEMKKEIEMKDKEIQEKLVEIVNIKILRGKDVRSHEMERNIITQGIEDAEN